MVLQATGGEARMASGDADKAGHGPGNGRAGGSVAAGSPYLDPARVRDDRQALALLSSILSAPQGCAIFATDTEGTILAWSESASALFGRGPRAMVGRRKWADLLPDSRRPDGLPEPLSAALSKGAWDGFQEFARADGARLSCQVGITRLRDGEGRPTGLLTLAREASQDLRRLADLQRAAAYAQSLFADNPVPVIGTDPMAVITQVNGAAEALLGRSRESLAGTRASSHFSDPQQVRETVGAALRSTAAAVAEVAARRPDGTEVPVSFSVAACHDAHGKLAGFAAALTDLTERNQGRADLLRSETYHRSLIEAAGDGLVAVDPAGFVTDVNGPACTLFGYRRDELAGSRLAECFAEPGQLTQVIERALAGEPLTGGEFTLAAGTGPARQVSLSASVFRIAGLDEPRVILSLHDVTEQAALRDRLAQERGYNRSIIESSANGLVMIDLRDRISDVNETMCRLTGRGRDELIGANFAGYFIERDAAAAAVHQALATGTTVRAELNLTSRRQPRQVSVSASPIRTGTAEVMGILASTRDITQEVRLQRALTAEQAYNRAIIDASLAGLFAVTPDGRISDANTMGSQMTGHSRARLAGRAFWTLFADQDKVRSALKRAFAEGKLSDSDFELGKTGPERLIVTVSGGVFTDPRGPGKVLLAVMRDITELKKTEERLRFYTESLFEAIVDAFAATDVLGVIVDANHPMEELVGHSLAEMTGHHLDEYFTEPQRARDFMSAVLRDGRATDYELTARRPDGSATVVSYSAATYSDSEGKVQGMLASARDVTERKRFEELQASLLQRARELDQAKTNFVSRISHELRSPLTSVLGYLELLSGDGPGPLTKEQRRMLEVINRNGRRLLSLIEDLLLLSRIEAGTVSIVWERVQLDALVRAVHESFTAAIRNGQLTCSLEVEPGLSVDGDARQLERVVANLISNAVKFTPPGGQIGVKVRRDAGDVIIQVRDTGIGIPEDEQPWLFTRFFRSAMATEQETQGTGLGLFIVKHVAQAHGGAVTVTSSPGAGSTFTVRLPARAPVRPQAAGREVTS